MEAVEALKEIGFWLERELAKTYRVEAFRKAAAAIERLSADELERQVRDGRLKRLKGIGDRTFGIISEAVAGRGAGLPRRPARARRQATRVGRREAASQARAATCTATRTGRTAARRSRRWRARRGGVGREYQVHDGPLAATHDRQRPLRRTARRAARRHRRGRRRARRPPAAQRHRGRHPRQRRARPDRRDARGASTSSSPACTPSSRWTATSMTRRMVNAIANPHTNVLGHCTGRLVAGSRGGRAAVALRRRDRVRRLRASSTSRSRSTRGPSGGTRRTT